MNNPGKPKVFYILTLLLILLFTLTAAFILYQTFSKKKKPAPVASLPQTETAPKPAAPIPSPSSAPAKPGILNPAQLQIASSIIIESTDSGRIKGKLNIENASDQGLNDLYYDLYLRYPEIQTPVERGGKKIAVISQGALLAYFESKSFTLNAKEKKSLPFELSFSPNLNPGSYKLQAFTITKDGQVLAGINTQLTLGQNKAFLELKESSCKLFVGEKEFAPNIGPNVDPGQSPIGRCQLTNPTSKTIRAKVAVDYAVRHVMNYPASEKLHLDSNEIITLAPKETKTVAMTLPAQPTPQVYEAYTTLLDEQNQPVSAVIPFRWIIRGPSAYIKEATLDKDFYLKGEAAKVSTLISPSMDLYWRPATQSGTAQEGTDLTNAKLAVRITTDKGILCGSGEKQLPSTSQNTNWNSEQIQVKIEGECINPKVETQIVNNNQSLAELSHQIRTSDQNIQNLKQNLKQKGKIDNRQMLAGGAMIIIIGLVVFILIKNRKKGPPAGVSANLVILLTLGTITSGILLLRLLLPGNNALAYTVYNPTGTESSRLWVRGYTNTIGGTDVPIFGDFWLSGSSIRQTSNNTIEVNFTGQLSGLLCENDAPGFQLSNYITDSSNSSGVPLASADTVEVRFEPPLNEENYQLNNTPVSVTYTLTTTGNLPAAYNLRIDQRLTITSYPAPGPIHYSTDENYPGDAASLYYNNPLIDPLSDGRQWCGGGAGPYVAGITIPGCMGRVEVNNFIKARCLPSDNPPDNPLQATLSWNLGTPGVYNSYDLRVDKDPVSWNGSCSPPNAGDICSNGLTSTTSTFTGNNNSNYNWWLSATGPNGATLPNDSITGPQFTCSAPSGPAITSLQIGNADPNQTNGFTGTYGIAGRQSNQQGSAWLNPMRITVNATPGSGSMKAYYVAFYDKGKVSPAQTQIVTDPTQSVASSVPISTLQSALQADPSSGFIVAYDPTVSPGQYYLWNPGINAWVNITGSGYGQRICGSNCSTSLYYTAFPGDALNNPPNTNLPNTWTILYDEGFGTKTMYTGVQVVNSNNQTTVVPNASPTP